MPKLRPRRRHGWPNDCLLGLHEVGEALLEPSNALRVLKLKRGELALSEKGA